MLIPLLFTLQFTAGIIIKLRAPKKCIASRQSQAISLHLIAMINQLI